ncbi:MAG: hypothetical protein ACH349_01465 [Candidatus Rhabdochlamydia sp.]
MTAPIGTSANVFTGTRELGQVTNTYGGYLQSGGAAYNLVLPWQADKLEWFNYTKFATNDNNCQGVWFRDFPAGDALIINRGTTTLTSTLEATNGVTINNLAGGFTNQHKTITGITTATPGVVTIASHGLTDGQRVVITKLSGNIGQELNNNTYVVDVLSANTFALYDVYGLPVPVVSTYSASGGQITITGPELGIIDAAPTYRLLLGTAVMGADNDVIYFQATKFNAYFNLGDVA